MGIDAISFIAFSLQLSDLNLYPSNSQQRVFAVQVFELHRLIKVILRDWFVAIVVVQVV